MRAPAPATDLPPAVVLGLSPTGLHVVRELGRAGVQVTGVTNSFQAGCLSRYLTHCIVEPDADRRLEALLALFRLDSAKPVSKPVLIPTSDQDIDFVIKHAEELSRHFAFQASYRDGLAARIMTKETFYDLCCEEGVAYPRLWKGLQNEIALLRDRIAYPCMIKPSRIHEVKAFLGGRKGWIVRDPIEFDRTLPSIPPNTGVLLLQEIVPGPESSITLYCGYFDNQMTIQQPFTARKLRQYPPGFGSASLAQSATETECQEISERFLRAVGYRGIAAVEFKRDPVSGILKMIEVNVRPSLWFSLTSAAGKTPVLAAYHALAQTGILLPESTQSNGIRWRYFLKDAYSAVFYRLRTSFILGRPSVNAVGRSCGHTSAVWSIADPKPVLGEFILYTQKLRHRLRRMLRGS